MLTEILLSALLIFFARVLNISISTIRTLLMTRGDRVWSAVMGFFEALIFAVVFAQIIKDLNNVWNLVGYSAGFSAGILLGIEIERRLVRGYATVHVVSTHQAHTVAEAIRQAGFGATESWGSGSEGQVGIVRAVVPRRELTLVTNLVNEADPASFVTVEDTLAVRRGHLGLMRVRS